MATFEDIQRKYNQLITSQNNIVDTIASYGVDIGNNTAFRNYASLVEDAVATKLSGVINGTSEFNLDERDFYFTFFIRRYAFYQNASLKNVVIPDWVTEISNNAFYGCTGITTVRLKGKTTIQAGVFNGCSKLTYFYLPDAYTLSDVPTLANVSAFNGTTCDFIVADETVKSMYLSASNWNTFETRIKTLQEAGL